MLSELNSAAVKCSYISAYISFELNFMPTQFWVFFNLVLLNVYFSTKLQESYPFIKLHREVGVPVRKVQNLILQFLCDDGGTEWITKSWRNIFVGFFPNFFYWVHQIYWKLQVLLQTNSMQICICWPLWMARGWDGCLRSCTCSFPLKRGVFCPDCLLWSTGNKVIMCVSFTCWAHNMPLHLCCLAKGTVFTLV